MTTKPYTILGLTAGTVYDLYLKADCGGGLESDWTFVRFATECEAISTFPWTENFKGVSTPDLPVCWSQINNNTDVEIWETVSGYGVDDSQAVNLYTDGHGGNNDDYLILPKFVLTGNEQLLFFLRARASGEPNDFRVVLSTTGNNPADFTEVLLPKTVVSSEVMTQIEPIDLSSYTGPVYIAIHVPSGGLDGWRIYVDDFKVEELPSCKRPKDLHVENITTSSAVLHWTQTGTATNWKIKISQSPIPTGAPSGVYDLISATQNSYPIVGNLVTGNTYYWRVQANCGGGEFSGWSAQNQFTVNCDVISTFPWTENFEGANTPDLPLCWSQNDNNSDGEFWKTNSGYGVGNSQAAVLYTDNHNGENDDYLILPKFLLTGNEQLLYHVRVLSSNEPNDYRVMLSTTGNNPADFTQALLPFTEVSSTLMTEINPIDLSAYSGEVYIAIHVPAGGLDGWNIYFDDFKVETIPSCPRPKNLFADNITTTSAKLNWTETGTATLWNLKISTTPIDPNTTTAQFEMSSTASFYNIAANTLNPSTTYYWYVQANCGSNDLSPWSLQGVFFTECGEISVFPFEENFDGDWNSWCWSVVDADNDGATWKQNNSYIIPRSGDWTAHGMGNNNDYLITPKLVINSTSYFVSWWDVVESSSKNNTYDVLVSTTDKSIASFTHNLGTFDCTNQDWVNHVLDLSAFNGQNIYIAFHQTYSASSNYGFGIDDFVVRQKSNENDIITFGFAQQAGPEIVNAVNHTVTVELAMGTDRSALVPTFTTSDFATVDFESGVARNFATPVTYNVTSQLGTAQAWTVNATLATSLSSANDILTFTFQEQTGPATIDAVNHTVAIEIEWNVNITFLYPLIFVSYLASVDPLSGDPQDFSTPITYTVTAEDGTDQEWVVTVTPAATPLGANCSNPIVVAQSALPYSEIGGSTCGMGDDYNNSCLGDSDEGEDIIYKLVLTQEENIEIIMTTADQRTGIAILNGSPDTATCIAYSRRIGSGAQTLNVVLAAGSYFIMIDNEPIPACISSYDLKIRVAPKAINVIDLNSEVENISVATGTTSAAAIAQLAPHIVITDVEDNQYTVALNWNITAYDANTNAVYNAKGTFTLPEGVRQRVIPIPLQVAATVTVSVEGGIQANETAKIGIYPNSNKGMFTLNFGTINDNVNYIIYDAKGSIVLNKNIQATGNSTEEVSLNLVPGVYFVKVITKTQTVVEKLVVE